MPRYSCTSKGVLNDIMILCLKLPPNNCTQILVTCYRFVLPACIYNLDLGIKRIEQIN